MLNNGPRRGCSRVRPPAVALMLRSRGSAELLGTLASRLMFPSTRTVQAGGTDLEKHHDKSRSVCSSTSNRFADSELCSDDYATNHHDHSRVRRWRGRARSESQEG